MPAVNATAGILLRMYAEKLERKLVPAFHGRIATSKLPLTVLASLCLVMTACGNGAENPQPEVPATAEKATGVLQTSLGDYRFTPTVCTLHKEDGFDDIEIHGPGTGPDGEEFYFELSSTGNHIVLQLGVNGPFASSERKLQAGQHLSEEFAVEVSGRKFSVPNVILVDENGQQIDTSAKLEVDCSLRATTP